MNLSMNNNAKGVIAVPVTSKRYGEYINIADIGYSNTAFNLGYVFNTIEFDGRSCDSDHSIDDIGVLTIFNNGTATWTAAGDTTGPITNVGDGFVWMESGTTNRGFCFNITQPDVDAADIAGTAFNITVNKGAPSGAINYDTQTMLIWAMSEIGFKLGISGIYGINAQSTDDMLLRITNPFNVDSFGKPLKTKIPDIVHVHAGFVDAQYIAAGTPGYTRTKLLNNITAMKDSILANGAKFCLISTISAEATLMSAALRAEFDAYNNHIASLALADNRVRVVEYNSYIDDPEDIYRSAYAGYMSGPHYTPETGAFIARQALLDVLYDILGPLNGRSSFRGNKHNLIADGKFLTSSGNLIANNDSTVTGESAWDVYVGTGIAPGVDIGITDVICYKEYEQNELSPWQVYESTTTDDSYIIVKTPILNMQPVMQAEIELYVDNVNRIGGIIPITFGFIFYDNDDNILNDIPLAPYGMTLRTSPVDQPTNSSFNCLLKTYGVKPHKDAVRADLAVVTWLPGPTTTKFKIRNAGAELGYV